MSGTADVVHLISVARDTRRDITERLDALHKLLSLDTGLLAEYSRLLVSALRALTTELERGEPELFLRMLSVVSKAAPALPQQSALSVLELCLGLVRERRASREDLEKILALCRPVVSHRPELILRLTPVIRDVLTSPEQPHGIKKALLRILSDACWSLPYVLRDFYDWIVKEALNDPELAEDALRVIYTAVTRSVRVLGDRLLSLIRELSSREMGIAATSLLRALTTHAVLNLAKEVRDAYFRTLEQLLVRTDVRTEERTLAVEALAKLSCDEDLQERFMMILRSQIPTEEDPTVKLALIRASAIPRWSERLLDPVFSVLLELLLNEIEFSDARIAALNSIVSLTLPHPELAERALDAVLRVIRESADDELRIECVKALKTLASLVPERSSEVILTLMQVVSDEAQRHDVRVEAVMMLTSLAKLNPHFARELVNVAESMADAWASARENISIRAELLRLVQTLLKHVKRVPEPIIDMIVEGMTTLELYIYAYRPLYTCAFRVPELVAKRVDELLDFPLAIDPALAKQKVRELEEAGLVVEIVREVEEPLRAYVRTLAALYPYAEPKDEIIVTLCRILSQQFHPLIDKFVWREVVYALEHIIRVAPDARKMIEAALRSQGVPEEVKSLIRDTLKIEV